MIQIIETWAALGPLLKPYLAFLYAEKERVLGTFREARSLYLDAINLAHEQKYTLLEGHLNECLGELLLQNNQRANRLYFVEAARLYRDCRAERKEANLVEKFPDYFEEQPLRYSDVSIETAPEQTLPDLALNYFVKLSLAISNEKNIDSILCKTMDLVLEISGAQQGYLVNEEKGDLIVPVESHIAKLEAPLPAQGRQPLGLRVVGPGEILKSSLNVGKKLEAVGEICKAIVRYVHRTGEGVILSNAALEGPFKDNPEVQNLQLRSVACLPLVRQGKTIGILYLENRLFDSAFTEDKLQMTELLMFQAVALLESARLEEELNRVTTIKLKE